MYYFQKTALNYMYFLNPYDANTQAITIPGHPVERKVSVSYLGLSPISVQ
jgi:hypothetical protein